ncbi:MAG: ATP-binding protein [Oscillospiraceae bacterium]
MANEKANVYASNILSLRRQQAAEKTISDREHLYEEIPELAALAGNISSLGFAFLLSTLKDDNPRSESDFKQKVNLLSEERAAILEKHGLPRDALNDFHFCQNCGDTGFLPGGESCECRKKLLAQYTLERIKKVSPLSLCSFDTFSLDYYSDKLDSHYGVSPRENMRVILKRSREFAQQFPKVSGNLLFAGDAGLGKTHLALSIAREVLKKGRDVIYCSAPGIFRQIEREQFEGSHDTTTIDSLKHCELLVLDDLGAEFVNAFVASALYDIVNTRICEASPTVFTTNIIDDARLSARYGEKVSSRLIGCCHVCALFGEDIRLLKNDSI